MTANQFSRRTFLGGTAAGAGLLLGGSSLITACSGSNEPAPAAPLTPVNFHLSWFDSVQFGGSYVADANGHYAAQGLDVTLVPGGPGVSPDTSVIAGQSIMGISAANFAGQAWADGAPLKVVGVAMQRNPFVIASLTSNPVNEPKDLEGRKLGMAFNNQLDLELLSSLNGVDVDAIEVIQADYDPAPLVNGEVDCLLCWLVDLPVAMTVAGIDNTTMLFADFGYAVHSQTYIVTEDTLATQPRDREVAAAGRDPGLAGPQGRPGHVGAGDRRPVPRRGHGLRDREDQGPRVRQADVQRRDRRQRLPVVDRPVGGRQHPRPEGARRERHRGLLGPLAARRDLRRRSRAVT